MPLYSPYAQMVISHRATHPAVIAGFAAFLLVDKHSHRAAHPASALRGSWRRGYIRSVKNKKRTRANLFYDTGLMVSKKDNLRPPLK